MKVVLDIEDNHASFVMELLKNFNYIHILNEQNDIAKMQVTPGINRYAVLNNKLSAISKLPSNWDNEGALNISQNVISIGRILIDLWEELQLSEKNIYVHIFPTFNGGIQFELDGLHIKADIEVLANEDITLTKYSGKTNEVKEFHYSKINIPELKRNLL